MADLADTERELTSARLFSLAAAIACTSIMGMTTGLAWTLLALRLEHRGYDGTEIGLNAAAQSLGIALVGIVAPALLSRFGVRRSCGAASLLTVALMLLLPLYESYGAWLLLRFILGACSSFLFIGGESWIVLIAPPRYLGRIVGILGLLWGGTFALGPVIVALAGAESSTPFIIAAAAAFCASLPLLFAATVPLPRSAGGLPDFRSLLRRSPAPLLALVLLGLVESSHDSLLPVYGLRLGFAEPVAVFLVTAALIGVTAIQLPIGWIADHMDRRRLLSICVAAGLCLTVLFGLTAATPLKWPLLFLLGCAIGGIWAVSLALIGDEFSPEQVASANAARAILYGAAAMAGPILAGASLDLWTPHGLIAALAAMWLLYLPVSLRRAR